METSIYIKPKNFIDFNAPNSEEKIDELLAEAEKSPKISFEDFFNETNKFRLNL